MLTNNVQPANLKPVLDTYLGASNLYEFTFNKQKPQQDFNIGRKSEILNFINKKKTLDDPY